MRGRRALAANVARLRSPTLPMPAGTPTTLSDGTVLVPRTRHGAHRAHLCFPDAHVVGRAYGRDELFVEAGAPRRSVRTTPGAVTVLPAGLEVTWDIPTANDFSLIIVPDHRLQSCFDELGVRRRAVLAERIAVDEPRTSSILGLIDAELTAEPAPSTLFLERAVDLLCAQLARAHSSNGRVGNPSPRRGLAPWQVQRVTSYMRDRLDQDVGLNELAHLVRLSRFHFCTAFRRATGRTPHAWFTSQRIDRARELLEDPARSISEVALSVGYATPSAFSASFRRLSGVTPSEYRRARGSGHNPPPMR